MSLSNTDFSPGWKRLFVATKIRLHPLVRWVKASSLYSFKNQKPSIRLGGFYEQNDYRSSYLDMNGCEATFSLCTC